MCVLAEGFFSSFLAYTVYSVEANSRDWTFQITASTAFKNLDLVIPVIYV